MVDVVVELVDGSFHDVDSSEMAFKIAGSMAVKEAARQAHPILLEPIMDVEVVTPSDYMGDVIGDLSARRGKIGGMTQRADAHIVAASVPLSEMFGYSTTLRSMSQGRAIYSMEFSHYQEVPKAKAEEIVSKVKGLDHGKGEIRAQQAACERGHHRPRGSRQDDPDGGAHEGVVGQGARDLHLLRPGGEGLRVAGAARCDEDFDDRDEHVEYSTTERHYAHVDCPGARRLREEHDHGRGADGRSDPRGERGGWPDAADARAHLAGASAWNVPAIVVFLNKCDLVDDPELLDSGGARSAGAAVQVPVPGR